MTGENGASDDGIIDELACDNGLRFACYKFSISVPSIHPGGV